MIKTGRNAPCICGSEKKYKKCCLYRGVSVPVSGTDSKTSGNILVKTLTDEFFQPVRLYYIIHNEIGLQEIFNQLKCFEYDAILNDWTIRYSDEAANIGLKVPPEKIPPQAQPLIIATIFIENKQAMLIDVRSIERAARVIEFINNHVPREIAEVTHASIYNELITATNNNPESLRDIDYDELFSDENITVIDPESHFLEAETLASQYEDKAEVFAIMTRRVQEKAKQPLPRAEKFPVYFYDEGIQHFETAFKMRQHIAAEHFFGNKDFSFYDLIHNLVSKNQDVLSNKT